MILRRDVNRDLTHDEVDGNFIEAENLSHQAMDAVEAIGSGEGGKAYDSLADALADGIPDNVVFQTPEGIWRRDSSLPEGAELLRKHPVNNHAEYELLNATPMSVSFPDGNLRIDRQIIIYNKLSGARYSLFGGVEFPFTYSISEGNLLCVPISALEGIINIGAVPVETLVELPYGSDTSDYLILKIKNGVVNPKITGAGLFDELENLMDIQAQVSDLSLNSLPIYEMIRGEDYEVEQGGISLSGGDLNGRADRVRTSYLEVGHLSRISFPSGIEFMLFYYDSDHTPIEPFPTVWGGGSRLNLPMVYGARFVRIVFRFPDSANISPEDVVGEEFVIIKVQTMGAVSGGGGIPSGGEPGDVLTPEGWDDSFADKAFVSAEVSGVSDTVGGVAARVDLVEDGVRNIETVLPDKATTLEVSQSLLDYRKKTDSITSIADEIVTPTKLSQSTIDLIDASGGGTITNLADDEDIESVDGLLKLKGEGVARFRLQSTPAENFNHFLDLLSTGLPIQISDSVDLSHASGSIREFNLEGTTLRFVGNGQVRNCHLTGSVNIEAGKRKIFDNVYFHTWEAGGVDLINRDSVFNVYLTETTRDVYNLRTKLLSPADTDTAFNPFQIGLTYYKIDSFFAPVLEGGVYAYKEDGVTKLELDVVDGLIQLPITKEYLFTDVEGAVLESTVDIGDDKKVYRETIAPEDLRVTRLIFPELTKELSIGNELFPEWFGAKANDESFDNKEAMQIMHLLNGTYSFAPGATYHLTGDVVIYGGSVLDANKTTLRLMNNSNSRCLYEIETRHRQDGITIYDLVLDGNKNNNPFVQDGIYSDMYRGIAYPFSGYSVNNTYWYNLIVKNFTGSGIFCATPGTSHVYSSYLTNNKLDGITWAFEHFTLNNTTCWGNGRHGAFAGGNHWRIIGGAFAHNGSGSNIHCVDARESQLIGLSCIDSGVFVPEAGGGYVASSQNVYGYVWAGVGQGTHRLDGGDGIYLQNCERLTLIGVRINNQNANGIRVEGNSNNITVSHSQFNSNNMSKGPFKDIGGSAGGIVVVDNSRVDGFYTVSSLGNSVIPFGQQTPGDWNDLLGTFPNFRFGVFNLRESWGAANRPSGSGTHLVGVATVIRQAGPEGQEWGRTFIDAMDDLGNKFTRYVRVDFITGGYSQDSGWISK